MIHSRRPQPFFWMEGAALAVILCASTIHSIFKIILFLRSASIQRPNFIKIVFS